jgi:Uma2 family endonuclease
MAAQPNKLYTPAEYLALERQAEYKSEYVDGEIFAMADASKAHYRIERNLVGYLFQRLQAGCEGRLFLKMRKSIHCSILP